MSRTETRAGEPPTKDEMWRHGLSEDEIPIWWEFLREVYPHRQQIDNNYRRSDWVMFRAGWLRAKESME